MKKIFVFIVLLLLSGMLSMQISAAYGHDAFTGISLEDDGKLLTEMTSEEIEEGYKAMGKRKFLGWKHHYFLIEGKASYIGEVIFAKSNRTGQPIEVNYVLQEKKYNETSWKISGSISGKIEAKVKKANIGGSAEVEGEKKGLDSFTRFEETKFKVTVEPNHRIVFHVTGDCVITNGVSKQYIFGICFKKGSWEYLDVLTTYYELLETEIKE
jgi:hypothetical protein